MAILIIEDEFLVATEIRFHLQRGNFGEIQHVATEKDALQAIDTHDWAAVVMDANLNGQRVDWIATELTKRKIPYVIVTGYGREGLSKAFADVPVINKPFQPQTLMSTVARLCERSNAASEQG